MALSFSSVLSFLLLSVHCFSISLQRSADKAVRIRANPLPPVPSIPVGPDRYPVLGTDITLRVSRPFGQSLPHDPTLLFLMSAQADLDRQESARGNVPIPNEWMFEEYGIKIIIHSPFRRRIALSVACAAVRGLVTLINEYPQYGTREGTIIIFEESDLMARIELVKVDVSAIGNGVLAFNSSTSFDLPSNVELLDPTNYHIPNTQVTVSLKGKPPYGLPLPSNALVLTIVDAISATDQAIRNSGDDALPGLWRFEKGSIGIDVFTHLSVDCQYSVLEFGLLGLVDLITEPGGVGAVAAYFTFSVDGTGEVASGRLKLLGPSVSESPAATSAPVTLIKQDKTSSVTLVGGAVETGSVGDKENGDDTNDDRSQFEKIYALALPGRADRTKPLLDAARASNMNFTVLDAVRDTEIDKSFWPKDWKEKDHVTGELGCLVSHVRTMISQNISTALIVESDADWDLRIRSILRHLAVGIRALIDYPFDIPHHTAPTDILPYGDTWDILWTGHCGSSHDGNTRIYAWNDSSVPPKDKTWKYKPTLTDEQHVFGTRSLFQFGRTTCTTSYAVSLPAAKKLVQYFKTTNEGLDETLSRLCTTKEDMVCLAVWPQVMLAADTKSNIDHFHAGQIAKEGEMENQPIVVRPGPSIQYSAWMNAERILAMGEGRDEWVPEWKGTWVERNGSRVFDVRERAVLDEELSRP